MANDTIEDILLTELDKHFLLTKKIEVIMATQQEAAKQIAAFAQTLGKVNDEIQSKIADLANAAASSSDVVTPELQNAINGLQAAVQKLDDIVPDAVGAGDTVPPVVDTTGDVTPPVVDTTGDTVPPTTDDTTVPPTTDENGLPVI